MSQFLVMAKSGRDMIDGGGPEEVPQRTCFFVSPLGPDDSPQRKRSDLVRRYIIEEALGGELNYVISRADLTNKSGDSPPRSSMSFSTLTSLSPTYRTRIRMSSTSWH